MTAFKSRILVATTFLFLFTCGSAVRGQDAHNRLPHSDHPWMEAQLSPNRRASLLVQALSLSQKEQQLTGSPIGVLPELPSCLGGRHILGIPNLEIPTFRITNGPVGIGQNDCVSTRIKPNNLMGVFVDPSSAKATALPSAIGLAATFDSAVATEFGNVIGAEARDLALQEFEAPGLNLARLAVLGRNFEYFGEDPLLSGKMATAEAVAVQNNGVIAMGKHFVANEQETNRMGVAAIVDDQVLHELYLLPFEMLVKDGNVGSLMCSYNTINGHQACQNADTLTHVLRDQWGFKGFVQSDFGAAHNTSADLLAGMDLELTAFAPVWTTAKLDSALKAGQITESDLDRALLRRYTQMFRLGIFDRPLLQTPIDFKGGGEHARSIGSKTLVLMQNNGVLPFSRTAKRVVLIGKKTQVYAQQAVAGGAKVGVAFGAGGGSSDVVPPYTVTPVEGLKSVLSKAGNSHATVQLILIDDDNAGATIDGEQSTYEAALGAAAAADQIVIMAGTISEEGADRASFTTSAGTSLVQSGDNLDWYTPHPNLVTTNSAQGNSNTVAMIKAVLGTTSKTGRSMPLKTVLVLKDSAGVALDPSLIGDSGPAILEAWFPGQEDGDIVAEALYGVTNPSGKLPVTVPITGHSFMSSVTPNQFPGVLEGGVPTVTYEENLNIGYRWYDSKSVKPAFPFGFGLSYTNFSLSSTFKAQSASDPKYYVKTKVTNRGKVDGSEVVQVYLGVPSGPYLPQPPKRLVGFQRVAVPHGKSATVTITIDPSASNHPLSVWDKQSQQFVVPTGTFIVYAGNSSQNVIKLGTFTR